MECKAYRMKNKVQYYPWGSPAAIPELLGLPEDGRPWAELWMGAHPRGPSVLVLQDGSQIDLPAFLEHSGSSLPFLYKVLAAAEPLSIQAHPNKAQAEAGFDREDAAGIARDAPWRNYRDRNHKPEIIVALTPFTALCGFRSPREIVHIFSGISTTGVVGFILDRLRKATEQGRTSEGLESFLDDLLTIGKDDRAEFTRALAAWAAGAADSGEERKDPVHSDRPGDLQREAQLVLRFLELHPEDPAAAAPLYLNLVTLKPQEALYQPAGMLHAYVDGTGIELMANSDNVLRGGLTQKHMDVEELKRVLIFESTRPEILYPKQDDSGLQIYPGPADEFQLCRFPGGNGILSGSSPGIIFVVEGTIQLHHRKSLEHAREGLQGIEETASGSLKLRRGESVFLPTGCPFTISGSGCAYIARLPESGRTESTP